MLAALLIGGTLATAEAPALTACVRALCTQHVPQVDRQPIEVLVGRVEASSTAGQHAEAARLCAVICILYPDHPVAEPARFRRVQALMAAGDRDAVPEAVRDFRLRHHTSRLLSELLLEVATWQYADHADLDAAQTYTDLVALATRADAASAAADSAPQPVICRSLSRWRAHQRAERSRTELERLARFDQALCYERAGERDAALRAYSRFVARFPQDVQAPEARLRTARLQLLRGDVEEARRGFRDVYADTTAGFALRSEGIYQAGRCEQLQRRPEAAAKTYRLALPLRPADDAFRLAALAELAPLLEEHEPLRALEVYRELAQRSADAALRAVALQRLAVLEREASVAVAHH